MRCTCNLFLLLSVVICGIVNSSSRTSQSISCRASIDPHQCVYASKRQKCYRQGIETKCQTTGWNCFADCCIGWKSDMKGKCSIQIPKTVCKSTVDTTHGDTRFCQQDSDCESGGTCCSNACTVGFQSNQCLYDNKFHTTGQTMTVTNDICSICTCSDNGGRGVYMSCTPSNCGWAQNETDIPSNYKPPEIKNAPQKGQEISVYVLPTVNIADLNYETWSGVDFEGTHLTISLSKMKFEHCLCTNSREMVDLRTEPDRYGNYYENVFTVNIIDKYKPVFSHCPHNQVVSYNETIVWEAPSASDNVGVRSLVDPSIRNNTMLPPGTYTLSYEATDWSNNTAYCTFTVTVNRLPDPAKERNEGLIIGLTIGGVFILIIILVTVLAVCRATNKNNENPKNKKVYENFANTETYGSTMPQNGKA